MQILADRFLIDGSVVVDLATGGQVRLQVRRTQARRADRARASLSMALLSLRHPLLYPLVDCGGTGERSEIWFDARAALPPLAATAAQSGRGACHLVRFLRAAGIELSREAAERNVRPVATVTASTWRPLGVTLKDRAIVDTIRAVLEAGGPPGVTSIVVHGVAGSGLRTLRLQLARVARLAGFVVADARFDALLGRFEHDRHLCVFEWQPAGPEMPPVLVRAACRSSRRHAWIRFLRGPALPSRAPHTLILPPLAREELMASIYPDPELGPSLAELQSAVSRAGGWPGRCVDDLTRTGTNGTPVSWVHESAPPYGAGRTLSPSIEDAETADGDRARGAALLGRGRLVEATAIFERGLASVHEGVRRGALLGLATARLLEGRLDSAEAAARTAALAAADEAGRRAAVQIAALSLLLRGAFDAAQAVLLPETACGAIDHAIMSLVLRGRGDTPGAIRHAATAVRTAAAGTRFERAAAGISSARASLAAGDWDRACRDAHAARLLMRGLRQPVMRLIVEAECASIVVAAGRDAPVVPRLRWAAVRLPPLAAAIVRARVSPDDPALAAFVERSGARLLAHGRDDAAGVDLPRQFQALLDAVLDAPDDSAALEAVAATVRVALGGCSSVIRSTRGQVVAASGRPWPEEEGLTRGVIAGAVPAFRDGLTPEAAEPIRAAGSTIGAVAVRWVTGAPPPPARAIEMLQLAATAAAAPLRMLRAAAVVEPDDGFADRLLGSGPVADRVREAIRRAAAAPFPVLIEGESGSGKELVARGVHERSIRRSRRFCAVNCAALTDDLLEAELFGHTRGAFTGAVAERAGLFEEADRGTLFLDEVGELSGRAQAKLLRVLQEGEVRRVGETVPRRVDVRIVAATNRRLDVEAAAGRFRADLRFRLDVLRIAVPPLRERADEIPALADRIWHDAAARVGTRARLSAGVIAALARYDWPGNVRELQNVLAALAVHGPRRGRIASDLLPIHIANVALESIDGFEVARLAFERRYVRAALARAGGRRGIAAVQLGVSRQGLAKMLKRLGITESSGETGVSG